MGYRSVVGQTEREHVVEKSRFLAYCAHTEGEEAAREFLARVRARHPLATHVCFGYVADKTGNEQRFSDDGEPQGTAGMPILNVIKSRALYETTVAVVRYFGGIKLGAGGLARAYSASAAEVCAAAPVCGYEMCTETFVSSAYSESAPAERFFTENGCEILSRKFAERVEFTVAVKESEYEIFRARLLDCLNGRAEISAVKQYYYPFRQGNAE